MKRSRQDGVGLVEIMISLTLGLIVTGAIVQIYLTTKRQSEMQGSLTGRQESSRFAALTIQNDAQMVGFRGCHADLASKPVNNTLNLANDFLYAFDRHVEGFEAANAPASIANVVAGTDVLTLRTVDDVGISVVADMADSSTDPVTTADLNPAPVASGDIVLIAGCNGASIFQVTAYDAPTGTIRHDLGGAAVPGNQSKDLGRIYRTGAQLFRGRTTTYYISDPDGVGPGRTALWRRTGLDAPQELAEGIENLQVLYGVDNGFDFSVDEYLTATEVSNADDWSQVISIQVALLAVGVGRVAEADARTFDLLGEVVGPFDDGRLRRVVDFTVAVRNRMP